MLKKMSKKQNDKESNNCSSRFLLVLLCFSFCLFILSTCLSKVYSKTTTSLPANFPWAFDPLANIDLSKKDLNGILNNSNSHASINSTKKNCSTIPNTCPICEVSEEWFLDFDGDDITEKAELRKCNVSQDFISNNRNNNQSLLTNMAMNQAGPQIILIYDSNGLPIIYKSNIDTCSPNQSLSEKNYIHFERLDFNKDGRDELIIVERNIQTFNDTVIILGQNLSSGIISELPVIEFETDLKNKLKLEELASTTVNFYGSNKNQTGYILNCSLDSGENFEIDYYQDRVDKSFYPLRITQLTKALDTSTTHYAGIETAVANVEFL